MLSCPNRAETCDALPEGKPDPLCRGHPIVEIASNAQFLESLRHERQQWEARLAAIGPDQMHRPGADGGWSVRDLVIHVTAYERALVDWLRAAALGQVAEFPVIDHPDLDTRNQAILERAADLGPEQAVAESDRVFAELLALVEDLPEEELLDPARSEWYVVPRWKQPRALWACVADDSYRHYRQHADIREERW